MSRTSTAPAARAPTTKRAKGKTAPPVVKGTRVSVAEARKRFAELLERVAAGRERFVIERAGKIVGFLGTHRDLAVVVEEEEDREDVAAAEEALREGGESIPWETVKADAGL